MDSQIVTEKGVGLFFPTWRERYQQKMLRVDLLQSSFEQVLGQKEAFAETFYQRLFMLYPQTRQMFAHTNMKHQQNVLMAALSTVISSLKNAEQEKCLREIAFLTGLKTEILSYDAFCDSVLVGV